MTSAHGKAAALRPARVYVPSLTSHAQDVLEAAALGQAALGDSGDAEISAAHDLADAAEQLAGLLPP
jgi:hypothetical protein